MYSKDSFKVLNIVFQITPTKEDYYTSFLHERYSICLLIPALANTESFDFCILYFIYKNFFSIILFSIFVLLGRWKVCKKYIYWWSPSFFCDLSIFFWCPHLKTICVAHIEVIVHSELQNWLTPSASFWFITSFDYTSFVILSYFYFN